jgi:phosphate/sulfate permease
MTSIEAIIILLFVGIVIGFMVGYFIYLIIRYYQKKNVIKNIKVRGVKSEDWGELNKKEVFKENVKEAEAREVEERDKEFTRPNRPRQEERIRRSTNQRNYSKPFR